jgi:lipoyl(octanoyl) transferase
MPKIAHWHGLTPYEAGVEAMEAALAEVLAGGDETVILCEHEAVLTVGSSGDKADIGADARVPVVDTGRGGKVTYHGPGQRVVYLVVNLDRWEKDVRKYVKWLQDWLIASAAKLRLEAVAGGSDEIGVWIQDRKVAAIGVRVRKGVAYHGIALNVENDLGIYKRFVPCGITDKGVTSLKAAGVDVGMADVDRVLLETLAEMLPSRP